MMKTIKANNFGQAIKEVGELDKSQLKAVKEEIKHAERGYYHLVGIKVETRPGEAKNKIIVNPMILNPDKFEKLQKNNKFLGYSKIIIVHDPSQLSDEDLQPTQTLHVHDKQRIEAEAKRQLEAKHKQEMEDLRKELEEKYKNGNSSDGGDGSDGGSGSGEGGEGDGLQTGGGEGGQNTDVPDPFENGDTVEAMKEFAKAHDIDLSGLKLKDEIKATLLTWQNEKIAEANQ